MPMCSSLPRFSLCLIKQLFFLSLCVCVRFGVSHTSESSLENGGRERDRGSGSDEEDDSRQSASDPGSLEESKDSTPSTPGNQSATCKLCSLPIFTQPIRQS